MYYLLKSIITKSKATWLEQSHVYKQLNTSIGSHVSEIPDLRQLWIPCLVEYGGLARQLEHRERSSKHPG